MCSLLSLLHPAAACSRRSETAPAPTQVQARPSVSALNPEPSSFDHERERVFSVGQQASSAAYSLRVSRVLECSGRDGSGPAPDRLFLGVELEARARAESVSIGHSHVKLSYGDGHTIAAEPFARTEECEPLLKYRRLAAQEGVKGWVVFSIPESASSLELRVLPRQFLNDQATLFDLGR